MPEGGRGRAMRPYPTPPNGLPDDVVPLRVPLDAVAKRLEFKPPDEPPCYTKRTLAAHLAVSVRTLDRAAADRSLPEPDLTVGRSPRWTAQTVAKWLQHHPRLPGRKGVKRG